MFALACLLLFALAAVAALAAMTSAVHANTRDILSLSRGYANAPRDVVVSWRVAPDWPELRALSSADRPQGWPVATLPQKLAA